MLRIFGVKLLFLPAPTHRQLTAAYDGITALFALRVHWRRGVVVLGWSDGLSI
jgi:hypothetical protein